MRSVDLAKVDLNLLVVLHALLETSSVTRAAERLGSSQPAISRALAKLRRLFGDRLMVKAASGMMPTLRAEAMREPLANLLGGVETFLVKPKFDPSVTNRIFRVATTDYGALAILPNIAAQFAREAPNAAIEVVGFSREVFRTLADGQVDFVLYSDNPVSGSFRARELFRESFVTLVRHGHPLLKQMRGAKGVLPLKVFTAWPHIVVSIFGGQGGPIDAALAEQGQKRHVALRVPYFATAAVIAAASDFLVTMPSRAARQLAPRLGLAILKPPAQVTPYGYRLLWHERSHDDPGAVWLRRLVIDAVRSAEDGREADAGFS
jgi:DNA-binding transcriptional LysR family regulator